MSTSLFVDHQSPRTTTHSGGITREAALRAAAASGLLAVGLIHFMDIFSKFQETFYIGVLYLLLIAACLGLAVALLDGRRPAATWRATALVPALTFAAYVASRTVGLPSATGDIGNWLEPLGLASLFVEGLVVLMAAWALGSLGRESRTPRPAAR